MNEKPDKLSIDPKSVTNREWLWLEDTCKVNVTVLMDHPIRFMLALQTLAARRWQASQGHPPTATFEEIRDGGWDDVEFDTKTDAEEADPPTVPADAG